MSKTHLPVQMEAVAQIPAGRVGVGALAGRWEDQSLCIPLKGAAGLQRQGCSWAAGLVVARGRMGRQDPVGAPESLLRTAGSGSSG